MTAESTSSRALRPGSVVSGKYEVEKRIGTGGMGQVYAAKHLDLGTRVAIKVLHASEAADSESRARFKREARASASIRSPHLVHVYDVGETDTGLPYMVMEYLDGRDLGSMLKTKSTLPVDEAVEYVLQACEGLAVAHEAGLVHRDLKPQNLFLSQRPSGEPHIHLLDFGIAKRIKGFGDTNEITGTHEIVGTPYFMAPEQIHKGGSVSSRTDVWGVGACLFQLLTGHFPFDGPNGALICQAILNKPAREARTFLPDLPKSIEVILRRCFEKDPQKRFANARDLGNALRGGKSGILPVLDDETLARDSASGPASASSAPPALEDTLKTADGAVAAPSLPPPAPPSSSRLRSMDSVPRVSHAPHSSRAPVPYSDDDEPEKPRLLPFAVVGIVGLVFALVIVAVVVRTERSKPTRKAEPAASAASPSTTTSTNAEETPTPKGADEPAPLATPPEIASGSPSAPSSASATKPRPRSLSPAAPPPRPAASKDRGKLYNDL